MNACLNEKELTRLFVSDAAEMPAARAHLAACAACTERWEELAREARTIAETIASAAASRSTLAAYAAANPADSGRKNKREPERAAGWFVGATAFGAAAAIAVMLALGWRPVKSARIASARPAAAKAAPVGYAPNGADRMTFDPISAIAYDEGGAAAAGSGDAIFTLYSGGDDGNLLFCAPGDDSGMCSTAPGYRG